MNNVSLWIPANPEFITLAVGPGVDLLKGFTASDCNLDWTRERTLMTAVFEFQLNRFFQLECCTEECVEISYEVVNGCLHVGLGVDAFLDPSQPDSTLWVRSSRFTYQPGLMVV